MGIKKIRSSKKISQQSMADMLGISIRQYRRIESGSSEMTLKTAIRIAEFLNVSLNDLAKSGI